MKLSLSWIYDHIEKPFDAPNITDIVAALNESTAEIAQWSHHTFDRDALILAQVTSIDSSGIQVYVPTQAQTIILPYRADLQDNQHILLHNNHGTIRWAQMQDLGSTKESLLPAVHMHKTIENNNWQSYFIHEDYTIEIDHKSITHRPDLWCHRGFARELCALYGWQLKPLDQMIMMPNIQQSSLLTIQDAIACRRIAAAYIPKIQYTTSPLAVMARLCMVDSKPINALVDITNYVMFDIGQPMHAFDASGIPNHTLIARKANPGQQIRLLDGETITLGSNDLIIADAESKPLSLAGIMGGSDASIGRNTSAILVESGSFDAATIRHSVLRHKKRTEASMRYEKELDQNQVVIAIARYMYLLHQYAIASVHTTTMFVAGPESPPIHIDIPHALIEKRLGVPIPPAFVVSRLEALDFSVSVHPKSTGDMYHMSVPSYRSTKDIRTKEDIIEEIGRLWGYNNIPAIIPSKLSLPADLAWVYNQRTIKKILQLTLNMHELSSYAFFDESWLKHLDWQPQNTLEVQHPVSGNWRRLITSLVPSLCKAIHDNAEHQTIVRFFEYARIWSHNQTVHESLSLAGIWADLQTPRDFYYYKNQLEQFFIYVDLPVQWVPSDQTFAWFIPEQTAKLVYKKQSIGYFGIINPTWQSKCIDKGSMAAYELDGTFLRNYQKPVTHYVSAPKYPDIHRDISIFVPIEVTADSIKNSIAQVDERIRDIKLIDFFHKKEWKNKKSLTFSFIIRDPHATLTGNRIDTICAHIQATLQKKLGAEVR
ncbi:MAG TPA: phenylalanine--tRNA ligase subunit beta [Candidatus Babeliales bacterium]|jgi:phenylalanyl-tRNA synthetase beta chain|nr:phenylalanine--tRNA ligase subunit beta [Candidatus Babeliales bacterium]